MTQPLVSILIPVYNRIHLVDDAIVSALNQTYPNIEIIISDNHSTDGTWEMLVGKYGATDNIKLIRTAENIGPVPNWRNCLDHARGEYVKFLFSDDWMEALCVEKMLEAIEIFNCDVVISSITEFSNGGSFEAFNLKAIKLGGKILSVGDVSEYLVDFKIPLSPGAALYKKSAVVIRSDFDDFKLYELAKRGIGPDLLMFIDASRGGCGVIGDFLNTFRRHKESISEKYAEELLFYYRLFLIRYGALNIKSRALLYFKCAKHVLKERIIK